MSDSKISSLTSATTPLAGTETLPVVQASTTKKVTVANLTAGRAVSVLSINQAGTSAGLQSYFGYTSGLNYIGIGFNGVTYSTQVGFDVTNEFGHIQPIRGAGVFGNLKLCPSGGDVQIGANMVPTTAAKGVNFTANTPAAGMTSQLLNWYEEGTWTPNQGAGLTLVGAFSSTGRYTRIGRQVSISGTVTGATSVALTAAGVITGNLPFTAGTSGHGNATNAAVNAFAAVICTSTNVTSAGAITATGTITFSATYFV